MTRLQWDSSPVPTYLSAFDPESVSLLVCTEVIVHFNHSSFLLNVPGQRPAFSGITVLIQVDTLKGHCGQMAFRQLV